MKEQMSLCLRENRVSIRESIDKSNIKLIYKVVILSLSKLYVSILILRHP